MNTLQLQPRLKRLKLGGMLQTLELRLAQAHQESAGLCIDVQHVHAAGWDLACTDGVDAFARALRDHGLDHRVGLVHANDSASRSGSRHDRHTNPGAGTIGARGFRLLAKVRPPARVRWILEVPGEDNSSPRRRDVRRLRHIVSAASSPHPKGARSSSTATPRLLLLPHPGQH